MIDPNEDEQSGIADRERGTCATCKHFTPDPEAGRFYDGEPNEYAGFCAGWIDEETPEPAAMLCGDWCERFAAKDGGP